MVVRRSDHASNPLNNPYCYCTWVVGDAIIWSKMNKPEGGRGLNCRLWTCVLSSLMDLYMCTIQHEPTQFMSVQHFCQFQNEWRNLWNIEVIHKTRNRVLGIQTCQVLFLFSFEKNVIQGLDQCPKKSGFSSSVNKNDFSCNFHHQSMSLAFIWCVHHL